MHSIFLLWAHIASLTRPFIFIEVTVPRQRGHVFLCYGYQFCLFLYFFLLNFRTVQTVLYFSSFIPMLYTGNSYSIFCYVFWTVLTALRFGVCFSPLF